MHLKSFILHSDKYPSKDYYPFTLTVFQETKKIILDTPVTFFVGENGTGKSSLLEALCHVCGIHIWKDREISRNRSNPYEDRLRDYLTIEWVKGRVPGSFFGSDIFRDFTEMLEEWAITDPGQLKYFGGRSLRTLSHGQSLMTYFRNRYQIKGLYLLDEPETALSPRSQLELLDVITTMSHAGHAQFVIASHSPILLACPDARIYSFDHAPVKPMLYEDTEHFKVYQEFINSRNQDLK